MVQFNDKYMITWKVKKLSLDIYIGEIQVILESRLFLTDVLNEFNIWITLRIMFPLELS